MERRRMKLETLAGDKSGIDRRGVLFGSLHLGSFLALTGFVTGKALSHAEEARHVELRRAETERFDAMRDSPLFREQLEIFIERYGGAELELALKEENGRARTLNDPKNRSRIDYVYEEVMANVSEDDIPEAIRSELPFYAIGMFATESKYQNDLESEADAQFIAQAVPTTYEDHGYSEGDMRYLTNQVEFAGRYFITLYKTLMQEAGTALDDIQNRYFKDKSERFQKEFLTLCVVNAYQVGPGNMSNVIKRFAKLPKISGARSYDVFEAMTDLAKDGRFDPDYQLHSSQYVKKAAAFAFLLRAADTSAV